VFIVDGEDGTLPGCWGLFGEKRQRILPAHRKVEPPGHPTTKSIKIASDDASFETVRYESQQPFTCIAFLSIDLPKSKVQSPI